MGTMTIDQIRSEYLRQIIAAASEDDPDMARALVGNLLDEWGAKAFADGWNRAFDSVRQHMDQRKI